MDHDTNNILITGATGRVGRLVVNELLRSQAHVRALTRRPQTAGLPRGVEVVSGDLTAPASLDHALDGIDTVFLVWTVAPATLPAVVDRFAAEKSRRLVYLGSPHRTAHPFFQQPNGLRGLHEEIERVLAASGLDVAVLRPGVFASNVVHWWGPQIRSGDVVRWPYADVETAPIDERDIAAVAARVLLDARYSQADCVLTGPQSLSHRDQVEAIARAIGRPLRFEELSPDAFRREIAGAWPAAADMLLSAWKAAVGQPAYVTSSVKEITGLPARTLAQWATDNRAAFIASA